MKLQGLLQGRRVLIFMDSGASHNFISDQLVAELGLAVDKSFPYKVSLGDGHHKPISGICKDLTLQLEGLQVQEGFYLFELGGVDLILGITWLVTLGEVRINWRDLTMRFIQGEKEALIKGILP